MKTAAEIETYLEELSCAAMESVPRYRDWTTSADGFDWGYYEAAECDECEELVTSVQGVCTCGAPPPPLEGPMMNYFYPLGKYIKGDPLEIAKKLAYKSLILVRVEDDEPGSGRQWGLALTGGGQDLTWEICDAHIIVGFLPPLHFCRPPRLAGLALDEPHRLILAACRRTIKLSQEAIKRTDEYLGRLEIEMKLVDA